MKPLKSNVARSIPKESVVNVCDNSGAKKFRVFNVVGHSTTQSRIQSAGVGDMVVGSVKAGDQDMKKRQLYGVIVRQKKEYKRPNGMRIKFEDNAVVLTKDEEGDPQGTLIKGPIAKEAAERWPGIAKLASTII